MLKRRIILGSLIAGAFLLPSVAGAGVVTGVCSNCHTMHASLDGVPTPATPNGSLLSAGANCVQCHAVSGLENDNTGRAATGQKAPQVDQDPLNLAGYINNAGYFNSAATATDAQQHNVVGIRSADVALGLTPPGNPTAMGSQLTCASCHGGSGIHHGSGAGASYRSLTPTVTVALGTQPASRSAVSPFPPNVGAYGAVAYTVNTLTSGNRAQLAYDSTSMNAFCASCHPNFHGLVNTDGATAASQNDGTWIRHPTGNGVIASGVDTTTALGSGPSIVSYLNTSDVNAVPVGTTGRNANEVMCISCHVPHGGPYADLLSFNYSNSVAGAGGKTEGCETCHSYSGTGM